jgi:outer membrane lipoprotein-sorting protein
MIRLQVLLCLAALSGALRADSLSAVLARMNKDAPGFRGIKADVELVTFTQVIDDTSVETGKLEMQRLEPGNVRAIMELSSGGQSGRTLFFTGTYLRMYFFDSNTYQDYGLGKNMNLVNSYLLLGFGSSGHELSVNYEITYLGEESVNKRKTSKLQLIPKDKKVLQHLTKVYIWIPEDGANPVQQQFVEPSGNYRKTTYSDLQVNPSFPNAKLEFTLPKGAKQIRQ